MADTDPISERRAGYLALAAAFAQMAEGYESLAESLAREAARRARDQRGYQDVTPRTARINSPPTRTHP
jgi:hypothetical protein